MDKAQQKDKERKFSLINWIFGREENDSIQIKKQELRDKLDELNKCIIESKSKLKLKNNGTT